MIPDELELFHKNVPEKELSSTEKEVAGIDRSVRHYPEFRRAGRTANLIEFKRTSGIRQKSGAEDRTDAFDAISLLNDMDKLIKRDRGLYVVPVSGVAIDQIELRRLEFDYTLHKAFVHLATENRLYDKLVLPDQ